MAQAPSASTTRRALSAVAVLSLLTTTGCASHTIYAKMPNGVGVAGQSYHRNQTSIFGDQGLNSQGTGAVATECGAGALTEVKVTRNVGQTLVTLLTLGAVTPATISYKCGKAGAPPPDPDDHGRPF